MNIIDNQHNISPSKYTSDSYESKSRFISYYRQISEVMRFKPQSVCEVGIGNGLVSDYLRKQGPSVTTVDINKGLSPDVVASVTTLPFANESFDVVLCAEVLEHLPYEAFQSGLSEIGRVCRKGAVVSLPHWGVSIYAGFKVPFFPKKELFLKISPPRKHLFTGEHYWEIGKSGFPARKVRRDMEHCGFSIVREVNLFEDPAHRFFILEKT